MQRFDFRRQDYLRYPDPVLAELRAAGPLVKVRFPIVGKTWITTTSDLTGRILKDNDTFTMRKDGTLNGIIVRRLAEDGRSITSSILRFDANGRVVVNETRWFDKK